MCSGIVNAYSDMALDNSLSTSNGYPIDQWPQYFGPNQEWMLVAAGDGPARDGFIFNQLSGGSLNDPASNAVDTNFVGQQPTHHVGLRPAGQRQ